MTPRARRKRCPGARARGEGEVRCETLHAGTLRAMPPLWLLAHFFYELSQVSGDRQETSRAPGGYVPELRNDLRKTQSREAGADDQVS